LDHPGNEYLEPNVQRDKSVQSPSTFALRATADRESSVQREEKRTRSVRVCRGSSPEEKEDRRKACHRKLKLCEAISWGDHGEPQRTGGKTTCIADRDTPFCTWNKFCAIFDTPVKLDYMSG